MNSLKYHISLQGEQFEVSLSADGVAVVNGRSMQCDISEVAPNTYSLILGDESYKIIVRWNGREHEVSINGVQMSGVVYSERQMLLSRYAQTRSSDSRRSEIRAPMPALVVRVEVSPGDQVSAGQGLIVLEAMKMENELRASHSGKVKEISVGKGTAVEKDQLLMLLE